MARSRIAYLIWSRGPAFLSSRPSPMLQTHTYIDIMAANAGTSAQPYFPLAQEREFFKYVFCIIQLSLCRRRVMPSLTCPVADTFPMILVLVLVSISPAGSMNVSRPETPHWCHSLSWAPFV